MILGVDGVERSPPGRGAGLRHVGSDARRARRPHKLHLEIAEDGESAAEIATRLGLPHDLIEGVFCNHTVYGLDHVIRPGDRIAFVPYGTPGPHRFTLGLYEPAEETADARPRAPTPRAATARTSASIWSADAAAPGGA